MDTEKIHTYIDTHFETQFITPLSGFVEIPNLSPNFDSEFFSNGLIQKAIQYVIDYSESLGIKGLTHHVSHLDGKPPMLFLVYE